MKTNVNENSLQAYCQKKRKLQIERVYSTIEVMPLITQPEIAKILNLSRQTVAGRCNDLKKTCRIIADGNRTIDTRNYECYRIATPYDKIEIKQKPIERLLSELKSLSLNNFFGCIEINELNKIIKKYE